MDSLDYIKDRNTIRTNVSQSYNSPIASEKKGHPYNTEDLLRMSI